MVTVLVCIISRSPSNVKRLCVCMISTFLLYTHTHTHTHTHHKGKWDKRRTCHVVCGDIDNAKAGNSLTGSILPHSLPHHKDQWDDACYWHTDAIRSDTTLLKGTHTHTHTQSCQWPSYSLLETSVFPSTSVRGRGRDSTKTAGQMHLFHLSDKVEDAYDKLICKLMTHTVLQVRGSNINTNFLNVSNNRDEHFCYTLF